MKIGIIADTHDNLPQIKKAVEIFNQEKVELVLHAGDFVSPFTCLEFKNLNCPLKGVFGNNDGDKIYLQEKFKGIGELFPEPYQTNINHKNIIMLHLEKLIDDLAESQKYEVIIYGHTHRTDLRKIGKTLIVNPGECGGWLSGKSTIALLDLENLEAKIINLAYKMQ
ncbi:MAG: YfcE family phosphodiesterase [Candidatus Infernicultor aquiphilus]|uniref:Phosphoesterase n=1 Tax=Candidatus Infernicultor aquiphilus TaxID=1805029 RepID=A0A1J5GC85_9BACT|nr:metallophosphoesterase [bacterium]OIP67234.1 MAG: YfcE family phosphodiesterase [Candidatus Atribacteria bacterium CG2_30_33_13]PIU25453.1 MAG: YfcE family phosphodiesterase [Candidatus Atribacteria bacterium CG08_land_8_20_14_0_20_33_29]PIW11671.1 MAG: YfcE family phosphodiesterase [Candidatus Atribacteria bacterium CG17_big_fil_post_rev_8_21_14_2_50_34_11]PIX35095.1 MAG: YfcE family phosphodiesterase [Candidatus Atribacteria bacterium CG_4_8_14_3_um_filter_34_18]PIY31445.1 MAG: YfcE famil